MVSIDALLLLSSWPSTLSSASTMLLPDTIADTPAVAERSHHGVSTGFFGWLRGNRFTKTLVGYRRLKALPPAPWPIQSLIDHCLIPAWLGTGDEAMRNLFVNLPFIGDAIEEGDLLQAAFLSALNSVWLTCARALHPSHHAQPIQPPVTIATSHHSHQPPALSPLRLHCSVDH